MEQQQWNIVLKQLQVILGDLDDMTQRFADADACLARIETTFADLQTIRSEKAGTMKRIGRQIDVIGKDLDAITRRLENRSDTGI